VGQLEPPKAIPAAVSRGWRVAERDCLIDWYDPPWRNLGVPATTSAKGSRRGFSLSARFSPYFFAFVA
jgi:hypothetical protein